MRTLDRNSSQRGTEAGKRLDRDGQRQDRGDRDWTEMDRGDRDWTEGTEVDRDWAETDREGQKMHGPAR